ncbi:hypothetical protein NA57DRAFT_82173 [Rhizodiscina lignyota]|uniref:Glycine zipper 2TM domain-containing protein n=1 Tax=Rhizodiscina lignyota TaxID=1504668 RepID=A0A9P4LZH6_9PEZI|nr:hypothetical protein NA57DRAFT_82173 [Rhizodiscina lignyota]
MAAQEYYNSFSSASQGPAPSYPQQRPTPYQQPQQRPPSFAPSSAPPPYSPGPYSGSPQQRPSSQQGQKPYFTPPPNSSQQLRPPGQGYDGSPLKPARSYSSPPAEHRHHHHHHDDYDSDESDSPSRSRSRSRSRERGHSHSSRDRGFSRDRGYTDERKHRQHHRGSHKDMDTFLGAGGGAIIGDAIFPGLGTIGGLILGGVGGREYAKRKERSQDSRRALREVDGGRRSRSSVPDYRYKE